MPLFLKPWIPKENPLRHSGDYSPARRISMFSLFFGYILFLILPPIHFPPIHSSPYTSFPLYVLPPIHSAPYTFFPLYVLPPIYSSPYQKMRFFPYLLIPQKNTMPLFLKAWIPKENPLRHLGDYSPTRHISTFSLFLAIYCS